MIDYIVKFTHRTRPVEGEMIIAAANAKEARIKFAVSNPRLAITSVKRAAA